MVSSNFQELGGISQPVDFVEYDAASFNILKESLGILHQPSRPGEFAIEVLNLLQGSTKAGLTDAANAR